MNHSFPLSKNKKIYVACPANTATGGPELLHQLVYELRHQGRDAQMFYYSSKEGTNPVHTEYECYANPFVTKEIPNVDNVILIVPEARVDILDHYSNVQKVIWWLSIDNFYKHKRFGRLKDKFLFQLNQLFNKGDSFYLSNRRDNCLHLVQSYYAQDHLLTNGFNPESIYYLSDYLNQEFIHAQAKAECSKENIVAFNPKKGMAFTQHLIACASNINFVPIQNMTRSEVIDLLTRAKVYIDFGNHPGKDRIPREAAICRACVITNQQGSAGFNGDVPIPQDYKFNNGESETQKIIEKINDCFENYDASIAEFEPYRQFIGNEYALFKQSVKNLFI